MLWDCKVEPDVNTTSEIQACVRMSATSTFQMIVSIDYVTSEDLGAVPLYALLYAQAVIRNNTDTCG